MGQRGGFGETGGAAAEEPCRRRGSRRPLVVEANPVSLAMGQQTSPRHEARWNCLVLCVKHHNARLWYVAILGGGNGVRKQLGFYYQELGPGCFEVVSELELGVRRVGAGKTTANGDDAQEEHGVVYLTRSASDDQVSASQFTLLKPWRQTQSPGRMPAACKPAASRRMIFLAWLPEIELAGSKASM